MLSLKSSKSRSFSKGIGKLDLESHSTSYLQKTISTHNKQQTKRISSISIVTKNTPSKQLHKENKENMERETAGVASNSEYIKSLYRKYLGKESEVEREKVIRPVQSQSAFKEMKDSTTLFGNTGGMTKMNSYRESANKTSQPVRSTSKKEIVTIEKEKRVVDDDQLQILELCDKEDSCIKAMLLLRQARKRNNLF